MKVFYNPKMSTDSHGFSPSGSKPAAAVADWLAHGLDVGIADFEPATEADLCLAHDPDFVRGVLSLKIPNGHGNRSKAVRDSLYWTNGSIMAAARAALTEGITCSPSSGFHHATRSQAMMFCSFGGICIAAIKLLNEGLVRKVGIVDLDRHAGNGTQDIIDTLKLGDRILHWSFGYVYDWRTFRQGQFMKDLDRTLREMKVEGVELIIAQCAADSHVDDPLGAGFQTTQDLRDRDRLLFDTCDKLGMPVTFCFGGGYIVEPDGSIPKVLEIHRNTAIEAIRVLNGRAHIGQASLPQPVKRKEDGMRTGNENDTTDSPPTISPADQQPQSDTTTSLKPIKPGSRIMDTTHIKHGILSIVGGVRAPRKD